MSAFHDQVFGLEGKTVAILCWSDAGFDEVVKLREQGINVVIGLREGEYKNDELWDSWSKKGFPVYGLWEAVENADIIQVW